MENEKNLRMCEIPADDVSVAVAMTQIPHPQMTWVYVI